MVVHSSDELNSWQRGMSLRGTVRCQGQQAMNEGGRERVEKKNDPRDCVLEEDG